MANKKQLKQRINEGELIIGGAAAPPKRLRFETDWGWERPRRELTV